MPSTTLRSATVCSGIAVSLLLALAPATAAEPSPTATSATSTATMEPSTPLTSELSLTASTTKVTYGLLVAFTGALTRPDGSAIVDAPVTVWSRTQGQDGRVKVGEGRTNEYGRVQVKLIPRTSSEYQMRFAGDGLATGADSNLVAVNVQPRLTAAFSPASVPLKGTSVLSGRLAPAYAGAVVDVRRRLGDGTYKTIAQVRTDSAGAYRWSVSPGLVGSYVFRAVLPARAAYLLTYTAPVALQVDARVLRQGDRGGDVLSLNRRLAAAKADVGPVSDVFDYDTRHALVAFQKSQGLPRTGVYDRLTSLRLAAPVPVKLRHPKTGRAVEIDLRKQVLYLSEGGVLKRIVDISSGNNQPYVSEGVTYKAFTPKGSFSVTRKIDGIRVSRLGELYRPAYFYSGWAIHGSKSVPTSPASHGCIRVTNPAQDRLFSLLTIGTPVTIYE